MQPSARILLNVTGGDKSYFLWNGTEAYYKKLRLAYLDILNNLQSDYLHFSFFTLCAATLEYSLNFTLTNFCLDEFGLYKYKPKAKEYVAFKFAEKLRQSPNIISKGTLAINENNNSYKTLLELITLRNKILHNKEFLTEFDFSFVLKKEIREEIEFEIEVIPNHIDTLTKDKCISFGKALGDFKKYIMTPALTHDLVENKMVQKT